MRRLLEAFLVLSIFVTPAAGAQQAASASPREVVLRVFDAMRAADSAAIRREFAPGARFASVAARGDSITYDGIDGWLRGVASSGGRWDEQSYDVQELFYGPVAHVWAPYTFYLDRAVRHCGVNTVSLLQVGGAWRVTQWSDSRRREGCRDPLAGR